MRNPVCSICHLIHAPLDACDGAQLAALEGLIDRIRVEPDRCPKCGDTVAWVNMLDGSKKPIDLFGRIHISGEECPHEDEPRPPAAAIEWLLFRVGGLTKCRRCAVPIYMVMNVKTGKHSPITKAGLVHFADCPHAEVFRRKETTNK